MLAAALAAGVLVGLSPSTALALLVAFSVVIATVYLPGVIFAAYLWIPPFYKAAFQPFSPIDLTVLLAILSTAQLAIYLVTPGSSFRLRPMLPWAGLALLILAGSLWASAPAYGLDQAVQWVMLVALPLLAVYRVASAERHVREFVWASFAAGLGVVAIGLLNFSGERLDILGANPLGIARAALFVPVLLYRGPAAAVLVPAALVVSFATGERGPLIALLVSAALLMSARALRERRIPAGALVTVGFAGVMFVLAFAVGLIPVDAVSRFGLLFEGGGNSTEIRLALFGLAGDLFVQHPLVGVGTAGYTVFALPLLSSATANGVPLYPHNLELQFAAEFGLLGLLALGLFLLEVVRTVRPATWGWRGVTNLALFTFAGAQVSGGIYDNRGLWGLLLLLMVVPAGAASFERRERVTVRPSSLRRGGAPFRAETQYG